jgi:dCTP deaminase
VTAGPLDLPAGDGVLASQHLRRALQAGVIKGGDEASVQPASVDLHLGEVAYRVQFSFLPRHTDVRSKLKVHAELDLRGDGAVLETNRPYLIPLQERLDLPPGVRGRTNPKSSTGRLDVFSRVIADRVHHFDEIPDGYAGQLWLEVVPLSFAVRVRQGLALTQLRLVTGQAAVADAELRRRQQHDPVPLVYRDGARVTNRWTFTTNGLLLGLDLRGDRAGRVGYQARAEAPPIDMSRVGAYEPDDYWEPVTKEDGDRVVLARQQFYLLLSDESIVIPPDLAAEMTAYDPTNGELRTHYAGFFDPGFGYDPEVDLRGSRAALEVRAHEVPFLVEHRQRVCKLTFERMIEPPDRLYGTAIGSSYQGQVETLSKHFRHPLPDLDQLALFSE